MEHVWLQVGAFFAVGFFLKRLYEKVDNMQFKFDLMVKEIEHLKSKLPGDEKN